MKRIHKHTNSKELGDGKNNMWCFNLSALNGIRLLFEYEMDFMRKATAWAYIWPLWKSGKKKLGERVFLFFFVGVICEQLRNLLWATFVFFGFSYWFVRDCYLFVQMTFVTKRHFEATFCHQVFFWHKLFNSISGLRLSIYWLYHINYIFTFDHLWIYYYILHGLWFRFNHFHDIFRDHNVLPQMFYPKP